MVGRRIPLLVVEVVCAFLQHPETETQPHKRRIEWCGVRSHELPPGWNSLQQVNSTTHEPYQASGRFCAPDRDCANFCGHDYCAQISKSELCRGTYDLAAATRESKALFTYPLNSVSLTPEKAVYENLGSRRHPSACLYGFILSESYASSKLGQE